MEAASSSARDNVARQTSACCLGQHVPQSPSQCVDRRRSITDFAKAFQAKKLPLHTLVSNGGVFLVPYDHTQEGFETTVGINYFGTFLLTHLLLDKLRETSPSR